MFRTDNDPATISKLTDKEEARRRAAKGLPPLEKEDAVDAPGAQRKMVAENAARFVPASARKSVGEASPGVNGSEPDEGGDAAAARTSMVDSQKSRFVSAADRRK
jgi:hypothetical protein